MPFNYMNNYPARNVHSSQGGNIVLFPNVTCVTFYYENLLLAMCSSLDIGCSNPNRYKSKSLKRIVTLLLNAPQKGLISRVFDVGMTRERTLTAEWP